ncbi:MAG: hypothetical protein U1B83_09925, partial [Candidatus Cloacimonadaceae bacterium]|nr:hypothetical protein [Candidatus Cloacimonadaceae bacterium]
MKRITFILVIALLFIQLQATVKFQLGAGVDLNGHHTFSNDTLGEDSDVNPGISIYGEVLSSRPLAIGDLMFGLGMEYQIPRELKLLSPAQHRRRYSYLPIYATVKYVLLPTAITPEAIVQGGYNFLVNHKNFEVDDSYNLSANGGFY